MFDFATLSWSKTALGETALRCRANHMAVCHDDAMIVMGGKL